MCTCRSQTLCTWCSSSAQTPAHHTGGFTGSTRLSACQIHQVRMWTWFIVCHLRAVGFLDRAVIPEVRFGNTVGILRTSKIRVIFGRFFFYRSLLYSQTTQRFAQNKPLMNRTSTNDPNSVIVNKILVNRDDRGGTSFLITALKVHYHVVV